MDGCMSTGIDRKRSIDVMECGIDEHGSSDDCNKGRSQIFSTKYIAFFRKGIRRWSNKVLHNPNGGDFRKKFEEASRAALASLTFFCMLNFMRKQIFPSIWIGNFFVHATLVGSLGAAIPFVLRVSRDLFLTIAISWSANMLLQSSGVRAFAFLLPLATGGLTYLIMLTPHLFSRNLMTVIMWVVLQMNVHEYKEVTPLYPLGILVVCLLGSITGILFTILPLPRPALASNVTCELVKNSQRDAHLLLFGTKSVLMNAGKSSRTARRAISAVELAVQRLKKNSRDLKKQADSAELERTLLCNNHGQRGSLDRWSEFLCQQQSHMNIINIAISNRLLGEEFTAYSEQIRDAKISLTNNLNVVLDSFVNALVKALKFCALEADISESSCYLTEKKNLQEQLNEARNELHKAWIKALLEAEAIVPSSEQSNVPSLAFLVRRIQLLYGFGRLSTGVQTFLQRSTTTPSQPTVESFATGVKAYIVQPWPKFSRNTYRLPLKAALGMSVASLWVVVPFLYERSAPFEYWPAVTVASVNLTTTGSSYMKCVDRLWGTLLASAYALLLRFIVGGDSLLSEAVKVPALTAFTFVAIYFRDPERPYSCNCAAISIGSILYGSIKNDFDVKGYVVNRIVLIFIGIIIFMVVEVFFFPRSSRRIVQRQCLAFFYETQEFFRWTQGCMRAIVQHQSNINSMGKDNVKDGKAEEIIPRSSCDQSEAITFEARTRGHVESCDLSTTGSIDESNSESNRDQIRKGHDTVETVTHSQLEPATVKDCLSNYFAELEKCQLDAESSISKAGQDLQSAFDEPLLGFSLPFQRSPWMGLVREQLECNQQMKILVDAIKGIRNDSNAELVGTDIIQPLDFECLKLPSLYADMIDQVLDLLSECCERLRVAFPDGRIRPQNENSLKALDASSNFRHFEDVRLDILATWSGQYRRFLRQSNAGEGMLKADSPGIMVTLGLTASVVLEICRLLQNAGVHLEAIVRDYPGSDFGAEDEVSWVEAQFLSLAEF